MIIQKIYTDNKRTLLFVCKDSDVNNIELEFIQIDSLPIYKFKFRGQLNVKKIGVKTNRFYTTELDINKFSPVDCGDFDG